MPYFITLAIVATVVSSVNLLFTLGVIRRLREHTRLLAEGAAKRVAASMADSPQDFSALTVEGRPVSRDSLTPSALVAFLSTGCTPCEDAVPAFADYAAAFPGGRDHVMAVITGPDHEVAGMRERLAGVAQVVVERPDGPVQKAFGVDGTPAFGVLDRHGVITVASRSVGDLPALAHA